MVVRKAKNNYMRELKSLNSFKKKDLDLLVSMMLEGSVEAREQIVLSRLTLVVRIAKGFSGRGLENEELIAEGNCGLLEAVNTYRASSGDFELYVRECIQRAISAALDLQAERAKERQALTDKKDAIIKAIQSLTKKMERIPTEAEVAEFLKIDLDELLYLVKLTGFYRKDEKEREED